MNIYIQQAFDDKSVFGNKLDTFDIERFEDIPEQDETDGKESVMNLLKQPIYMIDEDSEAEQNDKFQPIIDFPNFLLIVLKLTMVGYKDFDPIEFTLDDKELLNEFDNALKLVNDKTKFAKKFVFNLLKAKYLLDNYIVHHSLNNKELSGDNPWKLQYYYLESSKKRYPKNLSSTLNEQRELVHLLSMFEVSFTPKQRKNYLFYCMKFLFDNFEPEVSYYLEFLQNLANKYFYDVYLNEECLNERNQPKPNAFDTVMFASGKFCIDEIGDDDVDYRAAFEGIYKQGSFDVPLFVFNYADYKLWKKYADDMRGNKTKKGSSERKKFFDELGCSDFELDPFNNFYFSRTRKSLEHFYPQAKAGDDKELTPYDINCFGNFAMIGAEANSLGSNWNPKQKIDYYCDIKLDQVSVASLKFKIMMQMCQDNYKAILNLKLDREVGMEWNAEDMHTHQEKMLDILIG